MRSRVAGALVGVLTGLSCGGGTPGGAPLPATLKVRLKYGRLPSALHYEVRQTFEVKPPARGPYGEYVVRLSESVTDSEGEHHVTGLADSVVRTTLAFQVPLTPFYGWFDDHRHFLDTLMNTLGGEYYGALAFTPLVPLPDAPVGAGDSWTVGGPYHVQLLPLGALPAHGDVKIRRLEVVDGDTIVTMAMSLHVARSNDQMDVEGELTGEELFSVNRGVTLRVRLGGRIEQRLRVTTPFGGPLPSVPFQESIEQRLIP